jgi:hypothetical protein
MTKLTLTEAFAHYGAKLRNVQWTVSDIADGRLVVSLWAHKFRKAADGVMPYEDRRSRWSGAGNNSFRRHLEQAFRDQFPVRDVSSRCPQGRSDAVRSIDYEDRGCQAFRGQSSDAECSAGARGEVD